MSDFFRPPPPPEPEPEPAQPPWAGPPENELGVAVPLRVLLARTDEAALALLDASAYSTGLAFRIEARLRRHQELLDPFGMRLRHGRGAAELPDEVLRFGFELADGRRVTNLEPFPGGSGEAEGPLLMQRGGGGGSRSWSFGYWLWPLPPPGPLTVAVEWPAVGIALTRHELDTAQLLAAAAESEALWPAEPPGDGGWTGYGPPA